MPSIITNRVAVGLSGGLGALMATLCDVVQKEEASAVLKVTQVLNRHLELALPALYTTALFVICGIALAFIFATTTSKAAFYAGAGVIAMFMTITPYKLPTSSLPALPSTPGATDSGYLDILPKAFAQADAPTDQAHKPATVVFKFIVPAGVTQSKPLETILTIRDLRTGRRLWSGKITGMEPTLSFPPGDFQFAIQPSGYMIRTEILSLSSGESREVAFKLQPTWVPDFVQRLFRPGG